MTIFWIHIVPYDILYMVLYFILIVLTNVGIFSFSAITLKPINFAITLKPINFAKLVKIFVVFKSSKYIISQRQICFDNWT